MNWILPLLLLGVMTFFFANRVLDLVFYALLFSYLLSRLLVGNAFRNLEVRWQLTDPHILPGDKTELCFEIVNRTQIPFLWLRFHHALNTRLQVEGQSPRVFPVVPHGRCKAEFSVSSSRRGIYNLGEFGLELGDSFGLHSLSDTARLEGDLIVYPRIIPVQQLGLPSRIFYGEIRTREQVYADPARIVGVRDYVPGYDPLKHIHWKATAKTGKIKVKHFTPSTELKVEILLNLDPADYGMSGWGRKRLMELAISTAASIVYHLYQLRQEFGLVTNDSSMLGRFSSEHRPVRTGIQKDYSHLQQILEILARINTDAVCHLAFTKLLADQRRYTAPGVSIVVITPVLGKTVFDTCVEMRRTGARVCLILVGESEDCSQAVQRYYEQLPRFGVAVGNVYNYQFMDI